MTHLRHRPRSGASYRLPHAWWSAIVIGAGLLITALVVAAVLEAGQDAPWGPTVHHLAPSPARTTRAHMWPGAD